MFTSGEILYNENVRELKEGKLVADCIVYDGIREGMEFGCLGTMNGKKVTIQFVLDKESMEKVQLKSTLNILMQSDIFHSKWTHYTLNWQE